MLKYFSNPSAWLGLILIVSGFLGLLWACHTFPNPFFNASGGRTPCKVLYVYDGDTIACDINGDNRIDSQKEHIRLLGIDAPETHFSKKNKIGRDQPFSREAKYWMMDQALHKTVYLEFDRRLYDRYNRTLAFVYLSPDAPVSLNERIVAEGYAVTLFIQPNHQHQDALLTAEAQAKADHKGLWQTAPTAVDSRNGRIDGSTETRAGPLR